MIKKLEISWKEIFLPSCKLTFDLELTVYFSEFEFEWRVYVDDMGYEGLTMRGSTFIYRRR
jgi:hypothetical protein